MTQESVPGQRDRVCRVKCGTSAECRTIRIAVSTVKGDPELYLDLMTTRTGYLIKHNLPSARYNPVIALTQGDEGRIAG